MSKDRVKYKPDRAGILEISNSGWMKDHTLNEAKKIASLARKIAPKTKYVSENTKVVSGWRNEVRDGAKITDVGFKSKDAWARVQGARRHSLRRAIQQRKQTRR